MTDLSLLIDLHKDSDRLGPGGEAATMRAIELAGLEASRSLRIADIGCGTGAAAIILARSLNARVTAIDLFPVFLRRLQRRASDDGVAGRIDAVCASMDALPFPDESFDVLWSEGAVYHMGFAAGVAAWRRLLKPGGTLVVSEITWLTGERPQALQTRWESEYPEIGTAAQKLDALERCGYSPQAYFVLPPHCWLDTYYRPVENRFDAFLARHGHSPEARALVEAEKAEIALYKADSTHYGYGVYIAKKTGT